jgi:hypothetical protein
MSAKDEVVARYIAVSNEWLENNSTIARLNQRNEVLLAQANDCFAASRLFDFDLNFEWQQYVTRLTQQSVMNEIDQAFPPLPAAVPPGVKYPPPRPAPPLDTGPSTGRPKVKDHVLDAAKAAYPNAVRAAEISKTLAATGMHIHEKTVGMSLYRWLQVGKVRRDGRDWYYVPESPHPSEPASGSE